MKIEDLKKLNILELNEKLVKAKEEVEVLRFDIKTAQEKDYSSLKKKRKNVAKILTVINEKKQNGEEIFKINSEDIKSNDK